MFYLNPWSLLYICKSPSQGSKDVLISGCSVNDWWRQDNWISSMNTLSLSPFCQHSIASKALNDWSLCSHLCWCQNWKRFCIIQWGFEQWMDVIGRHDSVFSFIDCSLHVRECHTLVSLSIHCFKLTQTDFIFWIISPKSWSQCSTLLTRKRNQDG